MTEGAFCDIFIVMMVYCAAFEYKKAFSPSFMCSSSTDGQTRAFIIIR